MRIQETMGINSQKRPTSRLRRPKKKSMMSAASLIRRRVYHRAEAYTFAVRALRFAAGLAAALLSSACVVSLQPVYEPETIAFDPALVGSWASVDEDVTLAVERGEWHSYHVTVTKGDERYRLSARLTRVGTGLYLDVTPLDGTDLPALTLPVHGCYRLAMSEEGITLAELNYERLERRARSGTADLSMVVDARSNVVITATTAEIRQWLALHADEEGVFGAPTPFTRR